MRHEIVAARIGSIITTDPRQIYVAVEQDRVSDWIDRRRMQFMAACDLGPQWTALAEAPTLFCIENGLPTSPHTTEKP